MVCVQQLHHCLLLCTEPKRTSVLAPTNDGRSVIPADVGGLGLSHQHHCGHQLVAFAPCRLPTSVTKGRLYTTIVSTRSWPLSHLHH